MSARAKDAARQHLRVVRPTAGEAVLAASHEADLALVAQIKRGDAQAARAFHDRLRPVVDRTLRRLLGGGDFEREDVMQNVMVELVMSAPRFQGTGSLEAWASTITANVVYKKLRRRTLERRHFDRSDHSNSREVPDFAETGPSLGQQAATRESLRRVWEHLGHMDEGRAYAFLLHDVWGYDLSEVAAITESSVSAAQSRLVRGRKEIHERIASDPSLAAAIGKGEGR